MHHLISKRAMNPIYPHPPIGFEVRTAQAPAHENHQLSADSRYDDPPPSIYVYR